MSLPKAAPESSDTFLTISRISFVTFPNSCISKFHENLQSSNVHHPKKCWTYMASKWCLGRVLTGGPNKPGIWDSHQHRIPMMEGVWPFPLGLWLSKLESGVSNAMALSQRWNHIILKLIARVLAWDLTSLDLENKIILWKEK